MFCLLRREIAADLFGNYLGVPLESKSIGGLGKVLLTRDGPAGKAGTILWTCSSHARLIREWNDYAQQDEDAFCQQMIEMCDWFRCSLFVAHSFTYCYRFMGFFFAGIGSDNRMFACEKYIRRRFLSNVWKAHNLIVDLEAQAIHALELGQHEPVVQIPFVHAQRGVWAQPCEGRPHGFSYREAKDSHEFSFADETALKEFLDRIPQ